MIFKNKKNTIDPYKDLNYLKERREIYNSKISKKLGVNFDMNALLNEGMDSESWGSSEPRSEDRGSDSMFIVKTWITYFDDTTEEHQVTTAEGYGSSIIEALRNALEGEKPLGRAFYVYDRAKDVSAVGRFDRSRYELDYDPILEWQDGNDAEYEFEETNPEPPLSTVGRSKGDYPFLNEGMGNKSIKSRSELNLEGEDRYIVRIPGQSHDEFHDDMMPDFAEGRGSDVYSAFQEARKEASPGAKIYQVYDTAQDRSATGRFSSFGNRYNELDWYDEEQDLNWEDGDEFGLGGDYYDAKPNGVYESQGFQGSSVEEMEQQLAALLEEYAKCARLQSSFSYHDYGMVQATQNDLDRIRVKIARLDKAIAQEKGEPLKHEWALRKRENH